MDERKNILRKYLAPSKALLFFAIAATALTILLIILGISGKKDDPDSAKRFDAVTNKTGSYAYIDVVGIDSWVYQYDDHIYYTVEDVEGYLSVIQATDDTFRSLEAQYAYFTGDGEKPEPVRLYGVAKKVAPGPKEGFCEVYGITEEEFENYFGNLYLHTETTPSQERGGAFAIFALFAGIIAFTLWIVEIKQINLSRKSIQILEGHDEIGAAANELIQAMNLEQKKQVMYGNHYLFTQKERGITKYADVVWAYRRNVSYNYIPTGSYLVLNTLEQKYLNISLKGKKGADEEEILKRITEANPDVLLGYTPENQKAYKEMVKVHKSR